MFDNVCVGGERLRADDLTIMNVHDPNATQRDKRRTIGYLNRN